MVYPITISVQNHVLTLLSLFLLITNTNNEANSINRIPRPITEVNICNGEALSLVKMLIVPNKKVIALTKIPPISIYFFSEALRLSLSELSSFVCPII